ncbi:MAG: flagellin [Phycisphaerales bacterium]
MTTPSGISRVPTLMSSRIGLANINRTNIALLRAQEQISSGLALQRMSDDSVRAAIVGVLDDRLERSGQVERNLAHASASLGVIDTTLNEVSSLALEAKGLASEQINITSSSSEREDQAVVIDQMLQSLFNSANREGISGYVFGGTVTSRAPIESVLGGYRYRGQGTGLLTDTGLASSVPITLGGVQALAGTSTRVRGDVDLDPDLTTDTKLSDIAGARSLPIELGAVSLSINGGATIRVDLSGADSVGDVLDAFNGAIREYEDDSSTTVLGAGGVSISGDSLTFDLAPGNTLSVADYSTGVTAQDLGLSGVAFSSTQASGGSLDARLTWRTPVGAMAGLAVPLGSLRLTNAGRSATVDLSGASTLGDIKSLIEGAELGVRVTINQAGNGIDLVNELSTNSSRALSVSEVSGGGGTATALGIRSLTDSTRLADFNFGAGVRIVDNVTNPISGTIDRALNSDFAIVLGNGARTRITIDLRPQDMTDVQSVLTRVNAEIQSELAAAGLPSTALTAGLSSTTNGLTLTQDATFGGALRVEGLNNSGAAGDLGLLEGTYDATSATLTGADRAKVRVDSLFTQLLDLREALTSNSVDGIRLAAEGLETSVGALAEVRGKVGSYVQRVESASTRESDRQTLDLSIRSELRDTDYAEASVRFSLLQTQLQAGLQATSTAGRLSLLDYLR